MSNETGYTLEEVRGEVESLRRRLNQLRRRIGEYFVDKQEIADLMVLSTLAQEPLLLVGKPGTAKSDLIVKFAEALGLEGNDYFEYMLTKFTEPSEILGPVDINELKAGRYLRRVGGKLPECRLAFLDEIFKSNSAILNTLLTIVNERKFYQDGKPLPVRLVMLFAATNEIPEFAELAALRDRFTLKVESESVSDKHFEQLIEKGLRNESFRAFKQRPWAGTGALEDFLKLKVYLDHLLYRDVGGSQRGRRDPGRVHQHVFPDEVFVLFKRILRTLVKEDKLEITDRKVIKLYKLIRCRAFLFHGGEVRKEDLVLLRNIADRVEDFAPVRQKVDSLLRLT